MSFWLVAPRRKHQIPWTESNGKEKVWTCFQDEYYRTNIEDGEAEIGLIAQEVEAVLPDLVVTNPATGFKAVKYSNMNTIYANST